MVQAIPASAIVNVVPGVVAAGGTALALSGLILTDSTRLPIGVVQSFASAPAVGAYFGLASKEYAEALVYFGGYDNSTVKPAALLFAQYPTNTLGVAPFTRGGSTAALTLAQLQAITPATMAVTVNGVVKTSASINLSSAVSFSAAAAAIQTAFNAFDAVVTASVAASTFSVTGSISGTTLNVTAVSSGTIVAGATISGTGVTSLTKVLRQLSGTTGGVGTYQVDTSQSVTSTTVSGTYGTMTVSAVSSGTLTAGQVLSGSGVTAGTTIYQLGTGTGGTGTYFVSSNTVVSSTAISAGPLTVTYDSTASAFVITGGTPGTGTIGFASGTVATSLNMLATTGAVTSQGALLGVPATNMAAVIAQSTAWALFTTTFEPSTADKVLFAAWTNSTLNRFGYAMWDTDASPTVGVSATCAAALILAAGYSGIIPIYSPTDQYLGAFVLGFAASLDFTRTNARATAAFKAQSGIVASVTSQSVATNLQANGYNYYGTWSTSAANFSFFYPGSVTGSFLWIDTYVNEVWINAGLQYALLSLLVSIGSIPYTVDGYSRMNAACLDPITAAVNFGAIRSGVTLSAAQVAAVNAAAGLDIDRVLSTRGWYLQISDASAAVRQARGSPPCTFWYTDGGSVQQINLASLAVL